MIVHEVSVSDTEKAETPAWRRELGFCNVSSCIYYPTEIESFTVAWTD